MRQIWQLWKGEVSDKDCDYIINAGKKAKEEDAKIFANPEDGNVNVRKNKVAWIRNGPTIQELQEWFFKEAKEVPVSGSKILTFPVTITYIPSEGAIFLKIDSSILYVLSWVSLVTSFSSFFERLLNIGTF